MEQIYLKPMTKSMYHEFFKEYENDIELYYNKSEFKPYVYSEEKVDNYISRQEKLKRKCFAIMLNDVIVGEVKLYNIKPHQATLGITMKNDKYKNLGYGTIAEKFVTKYAFDKLKVNKVIARCVVTNKRSRHVLQKVGFTQTSRNKIYAYYKLEK